MAEAASTWVSETRRRIRELQDGLLEMAAWASESSADPESMELLLRPFRNQLEELYERDLPLAKLADESDLLLHVRGASASGPSPRVSVVTRLLTLTRDQVTRLAKQLGGVTTLRVPPALDMDLVGVAPGSLFIGFSADAAEGGDLTREAVRLISNASWLVAENRSVNDLASHIRDPAARDMAMTAVRHPRLTAAAGLAVPSAPASSGPPVPAARRPRRRAPPASRGGVRSGLWREDERGRCE